MYWMLMRPVIGWGAFLLVHAIGIPLVYSLGKAVGKEQAEPAYAGERGCDDM
ncbi:hypothetical protein [Sporomusa aerivorans]|uniref:hypothetical protein n=1 Tax=Sporomusa aerivorans TaxID=204936 RepID=UPI00352A2BEF